MNVRARPLWLVAVREVRESLRKKSVWVSFAVLFLASLGIAILPTVLGGESTERRLVTVGPVPQPVLESLEAAATTLDLTLRVTAAAGPNELRSAADTIRDGDADLGLVWGARHSEHRILERTGSEDATVAMVQGVLQERRAGEIFSAAGVEPDVLSRVASIEPVPVVAVEASRNRRVAAAFGIVVAMFVVVVVLVSTVASAVAAEKANRVSEVLLAVVPARSLLYGKVLGVGTVGFAMVVVAATPLVTRVLIGDGVPDSLGPALLSSSAWLAAGIVMYLLLAAMLGALADRTEEVGGTTAPLTVGLVGVYILSASAPETPVGAALGIFPLTSPLAMPARIAVGAAPTWQIVLSLALLPVGIVLIGRLAALVYARAIVRTGKRLRLREVLRGTR